MKVVSVQNPSNKLSDFESLKKSIKHTPSPIQLQQQKPSKKSVDLSKQKKYESQEQFTWPFFRPDLLINDEKFWDTKNVKFPSKQSVIFQGVLLRIGRNKKNAKGYCYKLTDDGSLYYFRREGDPVAKGSVQLSIDVSAHIEEQNSKNGIILVIRMERLEGLSMTLFDTTNETTLQFLDIIKDFCHITGFEKLYQQMEILGKGSFATVYKIKSLTSGKQYAAKTYYRETFETSQHKDKFVTMIKNEIMALRKVSHPGIIKLYEVIQEKDKLILVTELVNGGDLYSLIKISKRVKEKQLAVLLSSVCDALNELHKIGFVHRDLKLENIMLESKNSLNTKLVDFGFAEPINEFELISKAGTPGYIPPEIFKLAPYTAKGDVFSVGIIFYSLITGTSAFKGKNYSQVLLENRKCDINFDRSIWKEISPELKSLLKKMLAARPQSRITCADVLQSDWLIDTLQPDQEKVQSKSFKEQMSKQQSQYYVASDQDDDDFDCEFLNRKKELKSFYQRMNSQKTFKTYKSQKSLGKVMQSQGVIQNKSTNKKNLCQSVKANKFNQDEELDDDYKQTPNTTNQIITCTQIIQNPQDIQDSTIEQYQKNGTMQGMNDDKGIPISNVLFLGRAQQLFNKTKKP